MRIYLIRHGRQNSPLCNVNVPLSDAGRRQAELLGKRLKKEAIDAVWASDLILSLIHICVVPSAYCDLDPSGLRALPEHMDPGER